MHIYRSNLEPLSTLVSLHTVDISNNVVSDILQVNHLICLKDIQVLYLCGNPIDQASMYDTIIIKTLPSLTILDGNEVASLMRLSSYHHNEPASNTNLIMDGGGVKGDDSLLIEYR
jgi:hypothetical protein